MRGPVRDADAHRDVERHGRQLERALELRAELLGRGLHHRFVGVVEHDRELVATQARDQIARADDRADPLRDVPEQLVTDGVAEAVVHFLEAVEVEQPERERVRRRGPLAELERQRPVQLRAVRETGEGVVQRLVRRAHQRGGRLVRRDERRDEEHHQDRRVRGRRRDERAPR